MQTPASRQVTTTPVNTAKRTPQIIRPKTADATKPSNPGVIDLTDEDDRSSKPAGAGPVKIIGKQLVTTSKLVPAKTVGKSPNISQNKMVNISQVKTGQVLNKGILFIIVYLRNILKLKKTYLMNCIVFIIRYTN